MFGPELRARRTQRGLSLRALARHVNYSYSYLAKIESGDRSPPQGLAHALDEFFATDGLFVNLGTYGVSTSTTGLSEGLVPAESSNGKVLFVPPSRRQLLHGIVGGTALAVLSAGRTSPVVAASFGESKPIEVFRVAHQALINEDNIFGPQYVIPKVQRQIASMEGLLQTVSGSDGLEIRYIQACFSEFCGWLYQDFGDHFAAQDWLNVALSRAYLADNDELICFILARQSQLAGDMGDGPSAIEAAEAAIRRAPNERLAAIASTFGAHGHALAGQNVECQRRYAAASELNGRFDGSSVWGVWLDDAYISVHKAHSLARLGKYTDAIDGYQSAMDRLPTGFRRDRGVYLARQAVAHSGARDSENAGRAGLEALAIAVETQSGRIASDLKQVARSLSGQTSPAAVDFNAAFHHIVQQ